MDKDAVLGFVKKNAVSLGCAAVALLAIGALFYPLGGMEDTLKQQADEKAGIYATLQGYIKQGQRKQPINNLDSTDQAVLATFPNAATIKVGQEAVEKWKAYGDQTIARLVDLNRKAHPLLLLNYDGHHDELPAITYGPDAFYFARLYLATLSTDPAMTGNPKAVANPSVASECKLLVDNNDLNLQNDILKGGMPPSQADIKAAADALWENTYKPQIQELNGKPMNEVELDTAWKTECQLLPLKLKKKAARELKVYVEPTAFNVDLQIQPSVAPTPDQIWYHQMQVWIERDLAVAIANANSTASNVLDAPVKRLITIQTPPPPMYTLQPASAGASGAPPPVAGPGKDDAPIVPDYTVSVTGRYSNPMYDVVQSRLVVDVDATKVNQFIETLSKDRMMSVIAQNEWAVNAETESAGGYLYGNVPVVRLELTVESLFLRAWTAGTPAVAATGTTAASQGYPNLMPDAVKQQLGLIAPVAGAPTGPPPGGGGGFGGPMPGGGMPGGGFSRQR